MKKILIVEDTPLWSTVLKMQLEKVSIASDLAENGQLAIDKIKDYPKAYQGIIMDIEMPLMDGITATEKIRSIGFTNPIVGFSSLQGHIPRERALKAGMNTFFVKSMDSQTVEKLLEALCITKKD